MEILGAEFAYEEAGAGPAVVLAHGGTTDHRLWERQVPLLAEQFRVIRYDWLGHGESGPPQPEYARHEQLLALLDALGVDRAVLVGSSDGGKLALDATLLAPHRVRGLVLVGSGLSGHTWPASFTELYQERVFDRVGRDRLESYYREQPERIDPADLELYVTATVDMLTAGPQRGRQELRPEVWESAVEMFRRLTRREWSGERGEAKDLEPPARGRLGEVTAPTLVVIGTSDVPAIVEVSELLAAGIRGAVRVDLPETGHLPPLERPAEFNRVLLEFLDRLPLDR